MVSSKGDLLFFRDALFALQELQIFLFRKSEVQRRFGFFV